MATTISAPKEPLSTASTALDLEIETQNIQMLYLQVPVGDAAGNLMTAQQFDKEAKWTIVGPDPGEGNPGAGGDNTDDEPEKPDAELRPRRSIQGNVGQLPITRRYQSKPAKFKILIQRFAPPQPCPEIKLELVDNNKNSLATTTVRIAGATPKIEKFESTAYNFRRGAVSATLTWKINPAGRFRIQRLVNNEAIVAGEGASGQKQLNDDGEYQLVVGEGTAETRSITISSFGDTHLTSVDLGSEILGIYPYDGKVYAVVRDGAAGNTASIWCSDGRLDHQFWVPISKDQKTISIPAEAASRPGAVFAGNLYFIGGSSYDPDRPGSGVSYFNFETKTWVPEDPESAWPLPPADDERTAAPFPTPRMGHALLPAPNGRQLWLIGGYNGDGGALDDIWVYDLDLKDKDGNDAPGWTQLLTAKPKWEPRCLFGAAFCGSTLFVAGGFATPGGYPTYDDIWYCDTGGNELAWHKLDEPLIKDPRPETKQYRGCALAALGTQIYAFVSYRVLGDPEGYNKVLRVSPSGESVDLSVAKDWVISTSVDILNCYRFDTTPFAGGIFVRWLAPAVRKDTSLHYLMPF